MSALPFVPRPAFAFPQPVPAGDSGGNGGGLWERLAALETRVAVLEARVVIWAFGGAMAGQILGEVGRAFGLTVIP